ncbi:condensation domain-containing protein [Streptomyces sp. NPDC006656]|uniref:condensation domain-containing protein n=1 Tax=Streptomyces sp. NPDC006656 TaxID=3156899 RepID=UPI003455D088
MSPRPGDGPRPAPTARALAAPRPQAHPAAPLQIDVLLDGLTHPGRGLHTGQLHWRMPGPFDAERFTRAWRTVTDQEAVLRTALAPATPAGRRTGASGTAAPGAGMPSAAASGTGTPGIAVHPCAGPLIVHHPAGSVGWDALLAAERMREFDLTRPDPLRIAVLDEPDGSARILLTYHRAFLDPAGAGHLVGSFHRAHSADGRPRGGERRPDLRDHLQWIASQDPAPARAFWADAAPPAGSATLPAGDRGRPTHQRGHGRTRQRLTPAEADRLRAWAAVRGAAESTALQAAWALLLYRAHGGSAALPVAFAAAVTGRAVPLEGADRLPGPLLGALPVAVEVHPGAPLSALLAALTGRAVDLCAYEWVSAGQIHRWSGRDPYEPLTESVLAFHPPRQEDASEGAAPAETREAHGAWEAYETWEAYTGTPLALDARHEPDGGLLLTLVHDRTRIADADADELLWQTAALLRSLPAGAGPATTVAEALRLLDGAPVPLAAPRPGPPPRTLRSATTPGSGLVCLLRPPGAPEDCYDGLAHGRRGTRALLSVAPGAAAALTALAPALAAGEPVVLGGYPEVEALAHEVAGRVAAYGWSRPPVAVAATGRELAGALTAAGRKRIQPDSSGS